MPKNRTAQQDDTLYVLANSRERVTFVENWNKKPGLNADIVIDPDADDAAKLVAFVIANRDFEVLGTNAVTASVTFSTGGGIVLTTAGASADSTIVAPHLDTGQTAETTVDWSTSDKPAIAAKIQTGAAITDATIWYGLKLTNTPVVATDNDQVMFRYQAGVNDGKWQAIYSVGGTDYTLDTGVVVAASTHYDLQIDVDGDRVPTFYINGEEVAKGTALTANVDLIRYVGVLAGAAAAKAITVRPGYVISKELND
jgi:hypothetical protein